MDDHSVYHRSWQNTYLERDDLWRSMYPQGYLEFRGLADLVTTAESGMMVLDAGIGTGEAVLPLLKKGLKVTGIDISKKALEICAKKFKEMGASEEQYHLLNTSISLFEYPHDQYDIVIDYYTSQHIRQPSKDEFYNLVHRSLLKGGMFLLGQYSPEYLSHQPNLRQKEGGVFYSDERYFCVLSTDEMQELLESLGFCIESTYRYETKGFYEILASKD